MPELLLAALDACHQPFLWLMAQPLWLSYLLIGIVMAYALGAAGFVLARMGFTPLWVLLLLVPHLGLVALYVLAFRRWPRDALAVKAD